MRFAIVGALGIAVQLAVLHVLATVLAAPYVIATGIAVASAVTHNFVWHRLWTWRDRPEDRALAAFARFALANGVVSMVGNVALMAVLVTGAGLSLMLANAIAISACGLANYFLADLFVFSAPRTPRTPRTLRTLRTPRTVIRS